MVDTAAVILAAGKGTRMRSWIPKVVHPIAGRPMINYVIDAVEAAGIDPIVVVVGHGAEEVEGAVESGRVRYVRQGEQLGTGHAVACAKQVLTGFSGDVLILCGDTPNIRAETIRGLLSAHNQTEDAITVLSARPPEPAGYGRILRGPGGDFCGIVEEKDADQDQRAIKEVNTGVYVVDIRFLFPLLDLVQNDNAQGEYYLTDIVGLASAQGLPVSAVSLAHHEEILGVNSKEDLALAQSIRFRRIVKQWMSKGVEFKDPSSAYVDASVRIARGTLVGAGCVLTGNTVVGEEVILGDRARVENAHIPPGTIVSPGTLIIGSN